MLLASSLAVPSMNPAIETRDRWRHRLPHWEVTGKPHFITIRCAGSLPSEAVSRVREIHESLRVIAPNSPDFAALQRKYFLLCERYLDAGYGPCPFRDRSVCELTLAALADLPNRSGWRATHVTLMPNHVHLLLAPATAAHPLKTTLRGWKWHVAKQANLLLQRTGKFWQSDWFDRWARTDAEALRMRDYIRQNPVKASLALRWQDYPWTHSDLDPSDQHHRHP
ncbi:MAG: hypothetical protein NTV51_27395 [Verrucomicrobia bacterium]|nr:hypothetical protein [Verrucomicrobiota bacterium]